MTSSTPAIRTAFGPVTVMDLAGPAAYLRGAVYVREGRVEGPVVTALSATGTVRGSVPYDVELHLDGGQRRWSCTCPAAEDGSCPRLEGVFAPHDDYVTYREAPGSAAEVSEAIAQLADMVDVGFADEVVGLAEHAHRLADEAIQHVDDSDGWLTGISADLVALHQRACGVAHPDAARLAASLVELELTSDLEGFHRAAIDYADVLGEEGLAEQHRMLSQRWGALESEERDEGSLERHRVREALIGVALARRDVDALIAVRQSDLRTPQAYLEIAGALSEAGRVEEAERWARDGLTAHADRTWQTLDLREFLAELLTERGDREAAVELFWAAFRRSPSVSTYRRLLAQAAEDAERWREQAVAAIELALTSRVEAAAEVAVSALATILVEILLHEGRSEEAWPIAVAHGCEDRVWLTLACAVEDDRPLEVIEVYERVAMDRIEERTKTGYRAAVDLLARIHRAAVQGGDPEAFDAVLTRVRAAHKPKRNLMAMLAEKGW